MAMYCIPFEMKISSEPDFQLFEMIAHDFIGPRMLEIVKRKRIHIQYESLGISEIGESE